jgi:hypothetical protein
MYVNAGVLFSNAVALYKGVSSLNSAHAQARRECLASVIFSAISTEAFVNELSELARGLGGRSDEPGWVRGLGQVLGAAEDSHASIESKYHLARLVVTGQVFDKGAQTFQDFALLVDLRNIVVHAKPHEVTREQASSGIFPAEDKIIRQLEQRGVIKSPSPPKGSGSEKVTLITNLLDELSLQSVGRWACNSAAGIVNAVLDFLQTASPPSARFSTLADKMFRRDFVFDP